MAKISGQDGFKILLVAIGLLGLASVVFKYVKFGSEFDVSQIGQITGDNLLWMWVIAIFVIWFLVYVMGKAESGFNLKTLATIAILGFILVTVAVMLDGMYDFGIADVLAKVGIKLQSVVNP